MTEPPIPRPMSELLDEHRLAAWLDSHGLERGAPLEVEPLVGGASNAMFRIRRGSSAWVLRRSSGVALERADDGLRREFRFLKALTATPVPHPAPLALAGDPSALGFVGFVMEDVAGVRPDHLAAHDGENADMAFALVDALAALHEVDWRAAGLEGIGHPHHFHSRQVGRWSSQLHSYDGRDLPGIDGVCAWLEANHPVDYSPTIMHGDYHVKNVLVAIDQPTKVVAILDWETATIGDPLLDLVGFCETAEMNGLRGWPSESAIVERYAAARGIEEPLDLRYHLVLYRFRLAVILEGVFQRSLRDPNRPDQHAVAEVVDGLVARAMDLIAPG
jgi:aminoglycoside phosphotransferase (APT) family kinase protein